MKKVSAGQKISVEYFGINIFDTPHTKNVEIIDGIPVTVNFADDKHVQVKYIYETNTTAEIIAPTKLSNKSAPSPATSPTLSPTLSAIVA